MHFQPPRKLPRKPPRKPPRRETSEESRQVAPRGAFNPQSGKGHSIVAFTHDRHGHLSLEADAMAAARLRRDPHHRASSGVRFRTRGGTPLTSRTAEIELTSAVLVSRLETFSRGPECRLGVGPRTQSAERSGAPLFGIDKGRDQIVTEGTRFVRHTSWASMQASRSLGTTNASRAGPLARRFHR